MSRRRILAVASAGGHWVQLNRLVPAFEGHEVQYVTTTGGAQASGPGRVRRVVDASRSNLPALAFLVAQLFFIIVIIRPHVVVTTGAAPGLLALQIGKVFGARTVWIDSIANVDELSMSGAMARRWATLWLTQWPHLTSKYDGLQHRGAVL